MMWKGIWLMALTGCMSNSGLETLGMTQENVWNLSRLCIGMNESQVLRIMQQPHTKKTVANEREGVVYNIWFYVTRPTGLTQSRLVHQNLTPLTFANGLLAGWGFEYYHHILRQIEGRLNPPKHESAPKNSQEDKSLERTIDALQSPKEPAKIVAPPKKTTEILSQNSSSTKPSQSDKPKSTKPKKKDAKDSKEDADDEKRDKAIQEDNDQNFDFW